MIVVNGLLEKLSERPVLGLDGQAPRAGFLYDAQIRHGLARTMTTLEYARRRSICASQEHLRFTGPLALRRRECASQAGGSLVIDDGVKEEKHQFRRTDASQWWLRPASIR
ncbi:hypothetical protein [Pseudarthrobacter sulfonivorans]|uniref:hypothetical protein n=1 Tax=Pseudarthrobacter sulfonivorans TaxID=121292 RepID=UPI0012FDC907|nr:hypothetical protein [Pseudarthrobacter sulfonivorans]